MLTCKNIDQMSSDIVDDKVSGVSKMSVYFHLMMCKNCRTHIKNTRILVNSLSNLAEESDPPEELKTALQAKK